jgi:altronate hydrolase
MANAVLDAPRALKLSPADNVAIAVTPLEKGAPLPGGAAAAEVIDRGHKVALAALPAGAPVVKYGQVIGRTTRAVAAGEFIHSHNLAFDNARLSAGGHPAPVKAREDELARTFKGYRRADGRAATRNFIGVVASVNCSTTVCRAIADAANRDLLPKYPGIDGFVPIIHDQGCGMSGGTAEGMQVLHRTVNGYARHANFGGVLMVGLGCEVNQLALYGMDKEKSLRSSFNIQDVGGSRHAVAQALTQLDAVAAAASRQTRVDIPVSEIIVGLQCGGSDGMSGVTANPALGAAVDILVQAGGTAILSETPEIYGAEHLLTSRATPEVAAKLDELIQWWERHVEIFGASLDNNPSPGNKRGGLTTILEKSLGAVAKAGQTDLKAVYRYAEKVEAHGLVYMDTPGYDPVSATGQVAGGANIIAFTTGRGSCFGCRPTPSLKFTSSSELYRRMEEDMDFDCGTIASGEATIEELGHRIFDLIVETASGKPSKSELFGYGDNEFVPWRLGPTL